MKLLASVLSILISTAPAALFAQAYSTSSSLFADGVEAGGGVFRGISSAPSVSLAPAPFSRLAVGASVSPFGPGLQVTSYVASVINLRGSGNLFRYSTNLTTNGFNANAQLHFASAGLSADIYPFRNGFRVSPGVLVYNGNRLNATSTVAGGTSFTLNGDTYYSANANSQQPEPPR